MSIIQQLGSNLPNSTQIVRPVVVPFINSLVARDKGIDRAKYFGSYDLDSYTSNVNKYHVQKLEDSKQMQDHYSLPPKPNNSLKNLSKHLNITRVHEPNEIPRLYSQVYSAKTIIQANETGTYDRMRTSNHPARLYMAN